MRRDQIRGLLLEEAILFLLRGAGFTPVAKNPRDETIAMRGGSTFVKGRGGVHQIDAVADFAVTPPFANRQRLLVEAKYEGRPTGIEVVRNAVGVLKDTNEFWASRNAQALPAKRFHYLAAVFSASGFSRDAQCFAFAHDIHLFPLGESIFLQPVLRSIEDVADSGIEEEVPAARLASGSMLRESIRERLLERLPQSDLPLTRAPGALERFVRACQGVDTALVGVIEGGLCLFLVPAPHIRLADLDGVIHVRIWRNDDGGWFITRAMGDDRLFSFDLPFTLFDAYADGGVLTPARALNMKEDALAEIQVLYQQDLATRVIRLRLDRDWIRRIREHRQGPSGLNQV